MSHFHNNALIGASGQGGGYNIESSLRFRSSASAYLSRTPAVAGNRQTFTYSVWIKRGDLGNGGYIAAGGADANNRLFIGFRTSTPTDCFVINNITSGVSAAYRATNSLYRDISAWYHIVVAFDTTQATAADRIKIYVNNQEITSFETSNDPAQNALMHVNNNTPNYIGQNLIDTLYFDGYMTEFNFIDGQALTPSDFGETDEDTGVWKPKEYTGTYGTNGYYLPFSDNTSTTTLVSDAKPGTFSPTFISSNNNSGASTSSLAITKPSGVAPGDLMIAFFVMGSGEMNTLSGWTELYSSSSLNRTILSRIVDGSEGASFTFTSTTTDNMSGSIVAYRNAELDVVGTMGDSGGSPDAPGITVTKNSSILLGFPSSNQDSGGGYTSSGFTVRSENTDANPSHSVLDKSVNSGATGDITFTGGNTFFNRAILLSLSGTGNNFFPSGISLTADSTYDYMKDVPTLTDEDTANFATLNAVDLSNSSYAPTNANLTYYIAGGNANNQRGSIAVNSGKWYWECTMQTGGGNALIGVARADLRNDTTINFNSANGWYYYGLTGNKYNSGNQGSYGSTYTTGDVIGFALDMDSGKIWWSKNGTWQASGDPAAGTNAAFTNVSGLVTSNVNNGYGGTLTGDYNYGQRPFAYTPPTGFKKLNTYNLPDSTIVDGSQYFDTVLWTGDNSSSRTISTNFTPNFIWLKPRNVAESHGLFDTVRGDGLRLVTNGTGAEGNITWAKFVSNGFQVDGTTYNNSGYNFVGWHWKGSDSSAVSNTDGTITSTVSANPTSGFSIATGTMPASGGFTVGHGLGVAPDMYIFKRTTNASAWGIWHKGLSGGTYYLAFTTAAQVNDSTVFSASPTNQVLNIGSAWASGGQNFVAYCFAKVEGFSKFGSYTGNGSTDGPFIYTGFRPAFVLLKCSSSTSNWTIFDTQRNTYNITNNRLQPNLSNAEDTPVEIDILSNGFKLRDTDLNNSGVTFIYMAFAENPFKHSLAR